MRAAGTIFCTPTFQMKVMPLCAQLLLYPIQQLLRTKVGDHCWDFPTLMFTICGTHGRRVALAYCDLAWPVAGHLAPPLRAGGIAYSISIHNIRLHISRHPAGMVCCSHSVTIATLH